MSQPPGFFCGNHSQLNDSVLKLCSDHFLGHVLIHYPNDIPTTFPIMRWLKKDRMRFMECRCDCRRIFKE
ncbi:hypothetical protein RB195_014639 [Necator americanus]|uniref:Headcase middle domain-containing protein n=1 Tax=Necator americanus TaxID=51031 RepID=A0ABR1E0Z3_NECAM